jgi:hypothetical protein
VYDQLDDGENDYQLQYFENDVDLGKINLLYLQNPIFHKSSAHRADRAIRLFVIKREKTKDSSVMVATPTF